jgi:predicted glycosyltransferase
MVGRVAALRRWAAAVRPDIALSHNSYGQIVAARTLRIPAVTAMDYEHQPANHLAFRLARTVLLPAALRGPEVRRQGAADRKTRFYAGLKEEMYLGDFEPDAALPAQLGVGAGETLVVARPAPSRALYHSFDNPLFGDALRVVARDPQTRIVVLPRHPEQREAVAALGLERCVVPDRAVDSRSLLSRADLMIGAGGTMTREAALMGVPTLSLFAGRRPAVDEWLEAQGMMRVLRSVDDLPDVEPHAHDDRLSALRERGERLVDDFCAAVA